MTRKPEQQLRTGGNRAHGEEKYLLNGGVDGIDEGRCENIERKTTAEIQDPCLTFLNRHTQDTGFVMCNTVFSYRSIVRAISHPAKKSKSRWHCFPSGEL